MTKSKWIADANATPPMFYNLVNGRKVAGEVRRSGHKEIEKNGKVHYRYEYTAVTKHVDAFRFIGKPFWSLKKAMQEVEKMGANANLTEAITYLSKALHLLDVDSYREKK